MLLYVIREEGLEAHAVAVGAVSGRLDEVGGVLVHGEGLEQVLEDGARDGDPEVAVVGAGGEDGVAHVGVLLAGWDELDAEVFRLDVLEGGPLAHHVLDGGAEVGLRVGGLVVRDLRVYLGDDVLELHGGLLRQVPGVPAVRAYVPALRLFIYGPVVVFAERHAWHVGEAGGGRLGGLGGPWRRGQGGVRTGMGRAGGARVRGGVWAGLFVWRVR